MSILSKEKGICGPEIQLVSKTKECSVYRTAGCGDGIMTSYQVFPGVELIYNDFHSEYCFQGECFNRDIMEINHCRRGRFECGFQDGSCAYLEEGDLSVNLMDNRTQNPCFPLEQYYGVSIVIELEEAARSISGVLSDISIDLYQLRDKLCGGKRCYIMRAADSIEHIFSELYKVPDQIKQGYFKLKVLELLLFLSVTDGLEHSGQRQYFHKSQVDRVKAMKEYMTENLERRDTLNELSARFGIPLTAMKLCFKGVYGTSVYSFMRAYRIQAAAVLLHRSGESVSSVAGRVGYQNTSKFAAAFKTVMGMTPLEYKKANPVNAEIK